MTASPEPGARRTARETITEVRRGLSENRTRAVWLAIDEAPETWREPELVVEGWRLLRRLGAPARALRLLLRAYRRDASDPWLRTAVAAEYLVHRGPFAAWERARSLAAAEGLLGERAQALRVIAAIELRDFAVVPDLLAPLLATDATRSTGLELRARALHAASDREGAAAAAREAIEADRHDIGACVTLVTALEELGRSQEALDILVERELATEVGELSVAVAVRAMERGETDLASEALARAEQRFPLAEEELAQAIAKMRALVAYRAGRLREAADTAVTAKVGWGTVLSAKLEGGVAEATARDQRHRKVLAVPFVAQDDVTCVPATLTALSLYAGHAVEHAAVADAICYDGTATHVERAWAEARGFVVRELTLSFEVVCSLVDRGLPMSVVTTQATSGHMMAIVGYDKLLETLVLMDPGRTGSTEVHAPSFFTALAQYGPRGALLVPRERAAELDGLQLPDAELYDALHALHVALDRDDVDAAVAIVARVTREQPGHTLSLWCARALALHREDFDEVAKLCRELLDRSALDDRSRVLLANSLARRFSGRELEEKLEALKVDAGRTRGVFESVLARLAVSDARRLTEAEDRARRALATNPGDASSLDVLARCMEIEARTQVVSPRRKAPATLHDALELARLAAAADPFRESIAHHLVELAARAGERARYAALIEERAARTLARSPLPSLALASSLRARGFVEESLEALARARRARPLDVELSGAVVERAAELGRIALARRTLHELEPLVARAATLRLRALVAEAAGNFEEARRLFAELVEARPWMRPTAAIALGRLVDRVEGADASERWFEAFAADASAMRAGLLSHALDRVTNPAVVVPLADAELAKRGDDVALLCISARALANRDPDEASRRVKTALAVDPLDPRVHVAAAWIEVERARWQSARSEARAAQDLAIDLRESATLALASCQDEPSMLEELARLREAAIARSTTGAAVAVWSEQAQSLLSRERMLEEAREIVAARPDLWRARVLLLRLAMDAGERALARSIADSVVTEFDGVPEVAFALADFFRRVGDSAAERRSVERLSLRSRSSIVTLRRANLLVGLGRDRLARKALELALRRDPDDLDLLMATIDTRGRQRDRRRELSERVLLHHPEWDEDGLALPIQTVAERAWRRAEARPWDAHAQLAAASLSLRLGRWDAAANLAWRASRLRPYETAPRELLFEAHAQARRIDEASAACDTSRALPARAPDLWVMAARFFAFSLGDTRRALRTLEPVLDRWPHHAGALEIMVKLHDGQPRSLSLARERLKAGRPSIDACVDLAERELQFGQPAAAATAYLRAFAVDPTRPTLFDKAAELALHLDDAALSRVVAVAREAAPPRAVAVELRAVRRASDWEPSRLEALARLEPDAATVEHVALHLKWLLGGRAAKRALDAAALDPQATRAFRASWASVRTKHFPWGMSRFMRRVARRSTADAAFALTNVVLTTPVRRWMGSVLSNARLARSDDGLWRAIARTFVVRNRPWSALFWLRIARPPHADAEHAWLVGVAWSLLSAHRRAQRAHTIGLSGAPASMALANRAEAAFHLVCRLRFEAAEATLAPAETPEADPRTHATVELTRILLDAAAAPPAMRPHACSTAAERMMALQQDLHDARALSPYRAHQLARGQRLLPALFKPSSARMLPVNEALRWMAGGRIRKLVLLLAAAALVIAVAMLFYQLAPHHDAPPKPTRSRRP
ncbi:MAG: C39 family peptidase [Polyangiaceae bacterium]